MFLLLITIEIIVALLLMIVVLMQSSKGGGLAGTFGGGQMGTMFGVRRTADFLSKSTSILAAIFIGLTLIINIFVLGPDNASQRSIIQQGTPASVPPPSAPRSTAPAQQQNQQQQTPQSGN